MRVCIVTGAAHGIGGMQDHTRSLAKGLVESGHDVEVICDAHPDGLLSEERYGAQWHYLPFPSRYTRLPRRTSDWLRASYAKFRQLHDAQRFDIIHSESGAAIELVQRRVHRQVPLVVEWQGSTFGMTRAALRRFRRGDLHAKVQEAKGLVWIWFEYFQHGHWYKFRPCHWIVPSRAEFRDSWLNACLQRKLGHVVPNGIDTFVFQPQNRSNVRRELGIGPGPLLVCAGRLEPDKGMHHAIKAVAALNGAGAGAQLTIIGDGPERASLERLAARLGAERRVCFAGAQPHAVVARYLAGADVFLFPTERGEGAPLILPQAMACGAAVLTTTIGPVAEVVGPGEHNGIMVPPGDGDALQSALVRLLSDEELRQRMGESARRRVLAEYTVERMVERTVEVYERASADGSAVN